MELRTRVVDFVEEGNTHCARTVHFRVSIKCVNDILDADETAHSAFFGDKKCRINLIVSIVHRYDQVPPMILNPFVSGPILMQHHTNHRARFSLAVMHTTTTRP